MLFAMKIYIINVLYAFVMQYIYHISSKQEDVQFLAHYEECPNPPFSLLFFAFHWIKLCFTTGALTVTRALRYSYLMVHVVAAGHDQTNV